jgi:hypothetical protein
MDQWRVSLDSLKTGLHKSGEFLDRLSNYLQGGEGLWCGITVVGDLPSPLREGHEGDI